MISKDSDVTKEFVKLIFEAVQNRWYVEHALQMVKDEDHMKKIVTYLRNNKNVAWQDIEYEILRK